MDAEPFFIVSSGRSGTAMLHKALSTLPEIEMHHEYMVHHIQPLAVRRYLGLASEAQTLDMLRQTYGAAVHYSDKAKWGDSSNKLSWLIGDLYALFPHAKFVHLVRDGRKVAGSFFNKLGAECYDDRSTAVLRTHVEAGAPAPPPEKKFWWPLPRKDDASAEAFRSFDQFQRIAWHWVEINRVILNALSAVPQAQKTFVRLEDMRADPAVLKGLYDFLALPFADEAFAMFQRPHNVNRPQDKLLTDDQRAQFAAIASGMMDRLGYGAEPEYVVNY